MSEENGKLSLNLNLGSSGGFRDLKIGGSGNGGAAESYTITGHSHVGATEIRFDGSNAAEDTFWVHLTH